MKLRLLLTVCLALIAAQAAPVIAATPHGIFTHHMVLQRDMPIPVWGTGQPGEKVTVQLADRNATTDVDGEGKWKVELAALPAGGPHRMVIDGRFRAVVRDVLIGEVWLASGQSNMQWPISASDQPEKAIAESQNPQIRLYTVPRQAAEEPQANVNGSWQVCGPETTADFTAVGYYFGRALQQKLGVPVGIVSTNFGGTPAEAWTTKETLAANDTLKYYVDQPRDLNNAQRPYGLYNAMIAPLTPMSVRGAIWYQGESNAGRAWEYRTLFPTMINDWRRVFRQPEMPFFFVQLAPFMDKVSEPGDSNWAELREAQLYTTQTVPHTGMAVITDVGDEKDIHPKWKQPVGERLALAALATVYGQQVEYMGPTYKAANAADGAIALEFEHADGLTAKDGPLSGFAIAGADGKFVNAEAEVVDGNKVRVKSASVAEPKYVRYGWANFPLGNLWNGAGLPASPFRTDDLPVTTQSK